MCKDYTLGLLSSPPPPPSPRWGGRVFTPAAGFPGCCVTQSEPPGRTGGGAATVGRTAPLGDWMGLEHRNRASQV